MNSIYIISHNKHISRSDFSQSGNSQKLNAIFMSSPPATWFNIYYILFNSNMYLFTGKEERWTSQKTKRGKPKPKVKSGLLHMNLTQKEIYAQLATAYSFLLSHSVTYVVFKTLFTEKHKQCLLNGEIHVLTLLWGV